MLDSLTSGQVMIFPKTDSTHAYLPTHATTDAFPPYAQGEGYPWHLPSAICRNCPYMQVNSLWRAMEPSEYMAVMTFLYEPMRAP